MNRRNFLKQTVGITAGLTLLPTLGMGRPRHARHLPNDDPKAFSGREQFDRLLKLAKKGDWKRMPIGDLVGTIGMELRGTPYVGSTLELYDDHEICSVNLLGLDCVTFFESALGFARMLKLGGSTPEEMLQQVTFTRYRDGSLTDYTSRLHYTTDWFHDNERKGVVQLVTQELPGAERFTRTVNFMSTHPDSYRQLKANPGFVPIIAGIEREINAREMYFVPKEKVRAAEPKLQTGDIIGITTTIKGIDCSHTGMCYRDTNDTLRYLHASSTKKEVTLDDELSVYLASVTKHTGIMVARPLEVHA